ncbi:hypothetical protein QBC43DRAFT_362076 [Cladorrhinum sp. PSN259]|nr:hypothetical protein QBC43DRAFT_362076 [Cladorrhinum sp. PSN259]
MDPVTAIGLVSGILSFITFGAKLIQAAVKVHQASDGTIEENRTRQEVTEHLRALSDDLIPPNNSEFSDNDHALCQLAKECRSLSEQLIELLEKCKPKDGSMRQSLLAALKSKTLEKDITDLEKRLGNCRDQLAFHLQIVTSRHTGVALEELTDLVRSDAAKFDNLQRSIRRLERLQAEEVKACRLSKEALSQFKNLLAIPDDISNVIAQQRVLECLAFEGMRRRFDSVVDAHAETFQWLVYGETSAEQAERQDAYAETFRWLLYDGTFAEAGRQKAHALFKNWLNSEAGIFHISGKLGSGKSTLMKYLGEHAKKDLEIWAGTRKLVFAQFFFWRPGTELQKSLAGLYRSLLHDVLEKCPELIPKILPFHWKEANAMPWQVQSDRLKINESELAPALGRIFSGEIKEIYEYRFCFFIDGLDEYDVTPQANHHALANLLIAWAKAGSSSGGIKLCVSSRPDNAFIDIFSQERRLHLHELTRIDMKMYVRAKLQGISNLAITWLTRLRGRRMASSSGLRLLS